MATEDQEREAAVVFTIGRRSRQVDAAMLADRARLREFKKWLDDGHSQVTVDLVQLLDFDDDDRWRLIDLLSSIDRPVVFDIDGVQETELLPSVLHLTPEVADLQNFPAAKRAALEVAALMDEGSLEALCSLIQQRMREQGALSVRAASLQKEVGRIRKLARSTSCGGENVLALLPDAPVPSGVIVPNGWRLDGSGFSSVTGTEKVDAPIIITRRGFDAQRGCETLSVAFRRGDRWKLINVDRDVVASTRRIVDLASIGLPVTSNNAAVLVQYIADFESTNFRQLPAVELTSRLGFQTNLDCFLWGREAISASLPGASQTAGAAIEYRAADEGDDQILDGLHAAGTFEAWLEHIADCRRFPKAQLALYSALAPAMLCLLSAPNFIVDFSGETSSGKTTALRLAASCWGNPDERSVNCMTHTWQSTAVWRERTLGHLNGLPLILDETKLASNGKDVAETIYRVAQGRDKGRGSIKGTARQASFCTVLISSGEQPATSFTNDGGLRPRVLTIWGSPFEHRDDDTAQLVQQINCGIAANYGHAGPRFVRWLLDNRRKWARWKESYFKWREIYQAEAGDNPLASRMASYFATISVTAVLAHRALSLPWEFDDPIGALWPLLAREAEDTSRAALRFILEWSVSHAGDFWTSGRSDQRQPSGGWAGLRVPSGRNEGGFSFLGFIPAVLNKVLTEGGFEPQSTVRSWADRGWLQTSEGRRQIKKRVAGLACWLTAIRPMAARIVEN